MTSPFHITQEQADAISEILHAEYERNEAFREIVNAKAAALEQSHQAEPDEASPLSATRNITGSTEAGQTCQRSVHTPAGAASPNAAPASKGMAEDILGHKTCTACGVDKPLGDFHRNPRMRDGHQSHCKACSDARVKAYHQGRGHEKLVARRRRYYQEHRVEVDAKIAQWRTEHPERIKAHQAVKTAVKNGVLTKPTCCDWCGAESARIEAHHEDYSLPLQVDWLCPPCHRQRTWDQVRADKGQAA